MLIGIFSVLMVFILIKSCKVKEKYLAVLFPICGAICYCAQLIVLLKWQSMPYNSLSDKQSKEWYSMKYLTISIIFITAVFLIGYWHLSYIIAIKITPEIGESISCGLINAFSCFIGFIIFVTFIN